MKLPLPEGFVIDAELGYHFWDEGVVSFNLWLAQPQIDTPQLDVLVRKVDLVYGFPASLGNYLSEREYEELTFELRTPIRLDGLDEADVSGTFELRRDFQNFALAIFLSLAYPESSGLPYCSDPYIYIAYINADNLAAERLSGEFAL